MGISVAIPRIFDISGAHRGHREERRVDSMRFAGSTTHVNDDDRPEGVNAADGYASITEICSRERLVPDRRRRSGRGRVVEDLRSVFVNLSAPTCLPSCRRQSQ